MIETTVREFYTCHVYDTESNPVEGNDPLSCATFESLEEAKSKAEEYLKSHKGFIVDITKDVEGQDDPEFMWTSVDHEKHTMNDIIHNRIELCEKIFEEPSNVTDERLSRLIYKATACGCWCETSDEGVTIGTIVEGTDAETQRLIPYPFSKSDWDNALEDIEQWAEDIWIEASKEE